MVSGLTAIVDLSPLLGQARRRVVSSQGLRSDLAALIGDRRRAMQAFSHPHPGHYPLERTIPQAGERLLRLVEREAEHRQGLET